MQDAALRTYFAAAVLLSRGHGFVSSHFIEPNAGHPKPSVLGLGLRLLVCVFYEKTNSELPRLL